eukprot:10384.XXX_381649_383197_1 [CDS] Oithona nana genome sequencing.
MGIVVEVISQLEIYSITKEALEATRLGKHINELRRKASDKGLASRAKSLVKKWRELLIADNGNSGTTTPISTVGQVKDVKAVANSAVQKLASVAASTNGHYNPSSQPSSRLTSPAVSSSSRLSPGLQRHPHHSSSMPSSASSSPGLSRPTTPNHEKSRPVSPVSKTNVANKRLRKINEEHEEEDVEVEMMMPAAKKAKVVTNGISSCDKMASTNGHHHVQVVPKNSSTKVSQRKKKLEEEREHLLEQKLLTARRQASKVRTTQELVQELALRSSTTTVNNTAKNSKSTNNQSIANETKTELMNRFFESQSNGHDVLSPPLSDSPSPPSGSAILAKVPEHATKDTNSNSAESVEDILAQLPPIDSASILAEMNSEIIEEDVDGLIPVKKEEFDDKVKAAMVEELHSGQHESVNGNFNHDGAFREWHEVVTKETLHGDLLYILPYSVID